MVTRDLLQPAVVVGDCEVRIVNGHGQALVIATGKSTFHAVKRLRQLVEAVLKDPGPEPVSKVQA